jgi:lipopolysaccharide assembly protein A
MKIISYIVIIILIILGLTFALLNAQSVTLNYYLGSLNISLSLLLVITIGLGILMGLILALFPILKLKTGNYHLKSHIKQLERAIENSQNSQNKG